MTTESYVAALERRHRELDLRIQDEMHNHNRDDLEIAAMKRKKLELKDQLTKIATTGA